MNSGGIAKPPTNVYDDCDNFFNTGYSISKLDPPNINDKVGININISKDINKTGYCLP